MTAPPAARRDAAAPPAKPKRCRAPEVAVPVVPINRIERNDILATIRELFASGGPRGREQVIRDVAETLGYRRLGPRIREIIGDDLKTAVRRGILDNTGGEYAILCRSINQYTRDHVIVMLLAAMGTGWQTRDEATTSAARHLGFRQTGRRLTAAFKSAINAAVRRGLIERDGADSIRRIR